MIDGINFVPAGEPEPGEFVGAVFTWSTTCTAVDDRGRPFSLDDMVAAVELMRARALLNSVRFVASEYVPDHLFLALNPPLTTTILSTGDHRTIITGSTRGLGALAAYNLASAYRPEGVT